jgi:hypothetical protein
MSIEEIKKERKRAYRVYLNALKKAEGNLRNAALIADKKGFNRTVHFQNAWYEAIANCGYQTH